MGWGGMINRCTLEAPWKHRVSSVPLLRLVLHTCSHLESIVCLVLRNSLLRLVFPGIMYRIKWVLTPVEISCQNMSHMRYATQMPLLGGCTCCVSCVCCVTMCDVQETFEIDVLALWRNASSFNFRYRFGGCRKAKWHCRCGETLIIANRNGNAAWKYTTLRRKHWKTLYFHAMHKHNAVEKTKMLRRIPGREMVFVVVVVVAAAAVVVVVAAAAAGVVVVVVVGGGGGGLGVGVGVGVVVAAAPFFYFGCICCFLSRLSLLSSMLLRLVFLSLLPLSLSLSLWLLVQLDLINVNIGLIKPTKFRQPYPRWGFIFCFVDSPSSQLDAPPWQCVPPNNNPPSWQWPSYYSSSKDVHSSRSTPTSYYFMRLRSTGGTDPSRSTLAPYRFMRCPRTHANDHGNDPHLLKELPHLMLVPKISKHSWQWSSCYKMLQAFGSDAPPLPSCWC